MRIDRLDLRAFGGFTDKTLDLSAGEAGLHLIYGDNEAGKSTSLRAIIAWLFGIPARTSDDYVHPHTQMRVGGQLRLADGRSLEFVRRKGNKNTLLQATTDTPLDDALLLPFLPTSMNEELFKKFHGIDHERLEAGGKALLSQAGDLGQVLFSAATGIASSRQILEDLQNSAAELFKPAGSKPKVNQAIADFKVAKKHVKDASLSVADWKDLNAEYARIDAGIQAIDATIQHASKEKNRLSRLNRVKGALGQRREVLHHLQVLGDVLLLPEDFDENHKRATNKQQQAIEDQARVEVKLLASRAESESLSVRQELLENEPAILAIHKALGAIEKSIHDKPRHEGALSALRNDAKRLLKEVRPDMHFDDAEQLRPILKNKKWLMELRQQYSLLAQKKAAALGTLHDAEDKQQLLHEELAKQSSLGLDLSALKNAIVMARKSGDLEQRLTDLQQRAAVEAKACEQEMSRLGRFAGSLDMLLTLALPVGETLDTFEHLLQSSRDRLRDYARQQQALTDELQQAKQELAALLLQSDVPSVQALEAVRLERHQLWMQLKTQYLDSLATRYEQKVAMADHVSDRLRADADQVVKRGDLEAKLQNLQLRIHDSLAASRQASDVEQDQQRMWLAVWQPLGISPGTPREMKQWMMRVEKLLSNSQSLSGLLDHVHSLEGDIHALKVMLSAQIVYFDSAFDCQALSLEAMLTVCEQRLVREDAILERQRQLQHELGEAIIRGKRVAEDIKAIKHEQSAWDDDWNKAIEGLGLKVDAHPEYVIETFEQLVKFFEKWDDFKSLERRIWGMNQDVKEFDAKVFAFADGIGFKRDGQEATVLAAKLHGELDTAREARASLKKNQAIEKDLLGQHQEATVIIDSATHQLGELQTMAGVASHAELAAAGEASRHKRRLQQQLEMLEEALGQHGDGLSIAQLEQEAAASDIDTLDAAIQQVATQLSESNRQRDTLLAQRQTVQDALKAKDGSAAAANAAEEAEQHLSSMVTGAEQYVRFSCAALILKQRIEDYRKQNQTPVLLRAGELFAKLTLGAYARLRDELGDDDKPVLLGVRPNNAEVLVEQMSEGTRAQLYLALRLATLEQQHSPHSEPMPLVVDDILIGFDDKRTQVGLEVLADVAQQTQVLLFTHHRRVLDLSAGLNAPAGVFTHELA